MYTDLGLPPFTALEVITVPVRGLDITRVVDILFGPWLDVVESDLLGLYPASTNAAKIAAIVEGRILKQPMYSKCRPGFGVVPLTFITHLPLLILLLQLILSLRPALL